MITFWSDSGKDALKLTIEHVMKDYPGVEWRTVTYLPGFMVLPQRDELLIAMGSGPLDELKKGGVVKKNLSLNSQRNKLFPRVISAEEGGGVGHWMVSFSPDIIWTDAGQLPVIRWDCRLAVRFHETGSMMPKLGQYAWVDDFEAVLQYIEAKHVETAKPVQVALDLETMGLNPYLPDKKILTVSVSPEVGYSDVVNVTKLSEPQLVKVIYQLKELMSLPYVTLVGANLKYDLRWLYVKWTLECTNFKLDTAVVGSLLNENRSNSLNLHTKEYTDMGGYDDPFNDKHNKAHMEVALAADPKEFLTYAGGDTDAALQVAHKQADELKQEPGLLRFYVKLLHPAVRAFEKIERRGMLVDVDAYAELRAELTVATKEAEKQALSFIPNRIKIKHEEKGVSLTRTALLKDFLFSAAGLNLKPLMFSEKTNEPKTDKAHLMMFEDHEIAGPFIAAYKEWSSCAKTLGTYVDGFLDHLCPDGRFHPTYMFFSGSAFDTKGDDGGTNTGRLSATGPAVQTIPKHTKWAKKLRKCFPAPPGMVFWQADFSQGELRITACVADEPQMLNAYAQGLDLHCVTGAKLAGMEFSEFMALKDMSEDTPEGAFFARYRQIAKSANFGLLYDISPEGYQEYVRVSTQGKMVLTLEEAYTTHAQFFELYSKLHPWHDTFWNMAQAYGYVSSPLGRIRHLPLARSKNGFARSKARRQAINAPIQGCLSDMNLWAASILEESWGGEGENQLWIAGATHDSIYGYCPEHNKEVWLGRIVDVMQTLPLKHVFGWDHQIGFPADIECGPTFAELAKFKFAS